MNSAIIGHQEHSPVISLLDRRRIPMQQGNGSASPFRHGFNGLGSERRYQELDVSYDAAEETLWYFQKPSLRPCFSPRMLAEIRDLQTTVERALARPVKGTEPRYMVLASRTPRTFSLGGDLSLFAKAIRAQDEAMLLAYAEACIDVLYANTTGLGSSLTTVALVQGDALGGGFEAALSSQIIVAERSARFGLPEVVFNLFPGMGAYSFLSRRLGAIKAEEMILSGAIYSAAELHDLGIVDVLAEDGEGEKALREHLRTIRRRSLTHRALLETRAAVNPVTREELMRVTKIWVKTALRLSELDLRRMDHLIAAQNRRRAKQDAPVACTGGVPGR
jgi:DSF synthase